MTHYFDILDTTHRITVNIAADDRREMIIPSFVIDSAIVAENYIDAMTRAAKLLTD